MAACLSSATAHPHVFIDYTTTVLCLNDKIVGIRMAWTFDEMYSASLFHDYTSQPKGALTSTDIAKLHDEAFKDSAEEHYFTNIVLNGKALPVTAAMDFAAAYDGRKMTYRFTVPVQVAPSSGENTLDIDAFDAEFYIDFELKHKDGVTIENRGRLKLACAPTSITKDTTTFGPLNTRIVRCRFTGSGT